MPREWVIYGVRSSYVYDAAASLARMGDRAAAYVDNLTGPGAPEDLAPIVASSAIAPRLLGAPVLVPLMTPGFRKIAAEEAQGLGFTEFPPFVDPTAILAGDLEMAEGCQINAGAVIAARGRFGRFVLINRSASIGHHARLGDFVSIGPAAVLCGECTVGRGAFIGAGAVIAPQIAIGDNATVAAGAVVFSDVPEKTTVIGNPAIVKATRDTGYKGQTV